MPKLHKVLSFYACQNANYVSTSRSQLCCLKHSKHAEVFTCFKLHLFVKNTAWLAVTVQITLNILLLKHASFVSTAPAYIKETFVLVSSNHCTLLLMGRCRCYASAHLEHSIPVLDLQLVIVFHCIYILFHLTLFSYIFKLLSNAIIQIN